MWEKPTAAELSALDEIGRAGHWDIGGRSVRLTNLEKELLPAGHGPSTAWHGTVLMARQFRAALDHLDLVARPKVTGKRGIQIWIPVGPGASFDETQTFVERLSRAVGASVPDLVSWRWRTDERDGLARLDYTQNQWNKTLVAPYSVRPAPGGTVSVPIEWDELDDPDLRPDRWTVWTAPERFVARGDPFRALIGVTQALPQL